MHNDKRVRRALGCALKILPIPFWVLLIFGFDIPHVAIITLLCAVFHELAHVAAALALSEEFRFFGVFSGFRLSPKRRLSYLREALIALAGPLANFAVFLSTLPYFGEKGYLFEVGIISLFTALSNLLPIEGYDGYRILSCTARELDFGQAFFTALHAVSFSLIAAFAFLSLYLMKRLDGGYWIFFVFISILIKTIKKDENILFARKREKNGDFERFQEISSKETQKNPTKQRQNAFKLR